MTESTSDWMQLLKVFGSLALVVGLIIVLAYVARKFWNPARWGIKTTGLRITQTLPLDSKKKIVIVEVEGRRLVLGVGESISTLCELPMATEKNYEQVA